MNEKDLIATQTIKQVSEGGDKVRADLKATAAAQDQLASSSANLATVTETSAKRQTSAAAAFDALSRKMDPASRALAQLEKDQRTYDRMLSQNSATLDRAGQSLSFYKDKLNAAAVAAENLRRQQANASVNQGQGFNPGSANSRTYAAQFEAAAKAQDDMTASVNKLRAAINPLEVEQARLAAELRGYKQALDARKISQTEFAAAHALAGKRLGDFAQSLRQAGTAGRVMSGELVNMGYQLNDVVTGLALGQSPFMIIAQQGGQIVQILQNSKGSIADFAKTAASSFMSLFTASRVAVGGIAAIGASAIYTAHEWMSAQRDIDRALTGIGARTGTTVADINNFASANASATGLSVVEARNVAIEFTKTGNVAVASLKGLGDAVHGFSILTGTDAAAATKTLADAFSGDLVKAAQELNKTYGFLNPQIEESIRLFQQSGDRAKAMQTIIDAMAKDNARAAASVDVLTKAWNVFANSASAWGNLIGEGLSETLTLHSRFRGNVRSASDIQADRFAKQDNKVQQEGMDVVKNITPQIQQIQELEAALAKLQRAKTGVGATGPIKVIEDDGSEQRIKNTITALNDAKMESGRYAEQVAAISMRWGDVGQSTALALQASQNQLPVIEAVGGAARMAAQSAADYANAINQGKTPIEASALAASNLAGSLAQVNASAKETLFQLQNQAAAARAVTGAAQMTAQAEATKNQLLHDGVNAFMAQAIAAKQLETAQASATTQILRQVEALKDQNAMLKARQNGTEASVAASIAYKNAIEAGADETAAAALKAETLKNNLLQAGSAATSMAGAFNGVAIQLDYVVDEAAMAAAAAGMIIGGNSGSYAPGSAYRAGSFDVPKGEQYTSTTQAGYLHRIAELRMGTTQDVIDQAMALGSIDSTLARLQTAQVPGEGGSRVSYLQDTIDKGSQSDYDNVVSQLFDLKLLAAGNNEQAKLGVYNEQLSYFQSQPQTIANMRRVIELQRAIEDLTDSTNALNATNASLNPLYNGRGALSVGYYKAAAGLDMIAQGPTSGDQVPFHAMVNGGERIQITPAGQTGSNDNSKTIINNIVNNFGSAKGADRRSARQYAQGLGQVAASLS